MLGHMLMLLLLEMLQWLLQLLMLQLLLLLVAMAAVAALQLLLCHATCYPMPGCGILSQTRIPNICLLYTSPSPRD